MGNHANKMLLAEKYVWLTPDKLRSLMSYDPKTGLLAWKPRSAELMNEIDPRVGVCNSIARWNPRCAGKEAFTAYTNHGYRYGTILGRPFFAHRCAWAIYHGYWPTIIDHINRIRDDNRIANLREVTHKENRQNAVMPPPVKGVGWSRFHNKWIASALIDGGKVRIGAFDSKDAALAAQKIFQGAAR